MESGTRNAQEKLCTSATIGGPVLVHVRNNEIVRVRPLPLAEEDVKAARWKITVGEKTFEPQARATCCPYTLSFRRRIYNPLRLKYPMKRVGFEPGGKSSTENRGKGEFVQIGWDEAIDTVAQEITRIRETYGSGAVMGYGGSHHMWGVVHTNTAIHSRFFEMLGSTREMFNPNSWEGFYWGAIQAWGWEHGWGNSSQAGLLEDVMNNCQLIVWWSNDPERTWGYDGQDSLEWRLWLRELGIKQIFIDPYCNYTARRFAHKWIAPRPGTDCAIAASIAYIWITGRTYDQDYVATHTYGFDNWKEYVLGDEDGVPKTPEWAEHIAGVEAGVIRALAKEWASKRTTLAIRLGGANRAPYGHEWTRMMIILQAMQGLGKPGVAFWDGGAGAPGGNRDFHMTGYFPGGMGATAEKHPENPAKQHMYRLRVPEAIMNPPVEWNGGWTYTTTELTRHHFERFTYPEPGQPEVKMIYRYGGCYFSTLPEGRRWAEMYKSPKLEFIVGQTPWMEPESKFADILLPACTLFERNDISEWAGMPYGDGRSHNYRIIVYQKKCIEPLYESKPDLEIFTLLSEKLGFKDEYTEGNTEEDWIRKVFDKSSLPEYVNYEEFKDKGYFLVPVPEGYQARRAFKSFSEGKRSLDTPSGKIEFLSQNIQANFPDDKERPPVPHYIASWEGHTSSLVSRYPLQLITPHARYSYHTHGDQVSWIREIHLHRVFKDGYHYWPIQIHPADANARDIDDGDIVRAYNDRAAVLLVAKVTELIRPGTVLSCTAGWYEPTEPGDPNSLDRGGAVNLLVSSRFMSSHAPGQVSHCLIEIEKWGGQ